MKDKQKAKEIEKILRSQEYAPLTEQIKGEFEILVNSLTSGYPRRVEASLKFIKEAVEKLRPQFKRIAELRGETLEEDV